jgi:hypothetical protein
MAYEVYEMAKTFGQKPSDVALLDDCVSGFGLFCFNRGIAAFGNAVHSRMQRAGRSDDAAIARFQREREWARLMGADMETWTDGFADPATALDDDGGDGSPKVLASGF